MKRLITTSVILFFAFCAYAQDTNKTITLHEITVKAAKVVNRPDGMTIYPTDAQKQASNNGSAYCLALICSDAASMPPLLLSFSSKT
jgi:predicted lipoprotein with Yx(FWY)xxD motif